MPGPTGSLLPCDDRVFVPVSQSRPGPRAAMKDIAGCTGVMEDCYGLFALRPLPLP